jgi:hypothetical protein
MQSGNSARTDNIAGMDHTSTTLSGRLERGRSHNRVLRNTVPCSREQLLKPRQGTRAQGRLRLLAAALAARQISAGYACERRLGAVMARFIGATTDQGATHDRQEAPHQALGAITRAAPLFSTRLRWLCPATTRSFTRGPLASSLVMSASYQTDQNRRWQGPSHLPSSKRGDALSPAPVQLDG